MLGDMLTFVSNPNPHPSPGRLLRAHAGRAVRAARDAAVLPEPAGMPRRGHPRGTGGSAGNAAHSPRPGRLWTGLAQTTAQKP